MKILVFGASGLTGQQIVDSAVRQATPSRPSCATRRRFATTAASTSLPGDVTDHHAVGQAMSDQEAVPCALGAATPLHRDPAVVTGVRNITATMLEADVRRLVYLSFLGVPAGRHQLSALGRYVMAPIVLRNVAADHAKKEEIIRRTGARLDDRPPAAADQRPEDRRLPARRNHPRHPGRAPDLARRRRGLRAHPTHRPHLPAPRPRGDAGLARLVGECGI